MGFLARENGAIQYTTLTDVTWRSKAVRGLAPPPRRPDNVVCRGPWREDRLQQFTLQGAVGMSHQFLVKPARRGPDIRHSSMDQRVLSPEQTGDRGPRQPEALRHQGRPLISVAPQVLDRGPTRRMTTQGKGFGERRTTARVKSALLKPRLLEALASGRTQMLFGLVRRVWRPGPPARHICWTSPSSPLARFLSLVA